MSTNEIIYIVRINSKKEKNLFLSLNNYIIKILFYLKNLTYEKDNNVKCIFQLTITSDNVFRYFLKIIFNNSSSYFGNYLHDEKTFKNFCTKLKKKHDYTNIIINIETIDEAAGKTTTFSDKKISKFISSLNEFNNDFYWHNVVTTCIRATPTTYIETDPMFTCVVCFSNIRNVLFDTCNHLSICEYCSKHIDKCPICLCYSSRRKIFL